MIYLDNASTTEYKPQEVVDATLQCLTKFPYNPNRGNAVYAMQLQQKLMDTRKKLSLLFRNDSEMHVVFTSGCTAAINLGILGNAKRGHIVVSATEHNAVLRTVMQLKRRGIAEVSIATADEDGQVTLQSVQKVWKPNTYLVCISHASNVTGTRQNLVGIGQFAKQNGALLLVDCAQSVGYFTLDMFKDNVDMIAIGAHKGLHAMQGAGALVFNKRATPRPTVFGGTGTESHLYFQPDTIPDSLESGTLPTPAIIAMSAGIDWWLANWQQNDKIVTQMQQTLLDGLKQIPDVRVYSKQNKSGIVAFNVGSVESGIVADTLAEKYNIAVRGGLQCAPLMHKHLGTFEQGVVRASVSCMTTDNDCYRLLNAVEEIAKSLR